MSLHRRTRLACAAAAWLLAGVASAPAMVDETESGKPERVAVIVKLRPTLDACVDCLVRRGQSLADEVGPTFDAVGRQFGLEDVRPLIPAYAPLASVAERRTAEVRHGKGRATASVTASTTPPTFASTYVLRFPADVDADAVAAALAADPAVEYAESDVVRHVAFAPSDPFFATSGSWGQPYGDLWGLHAIDAPAAWDVARGAGVVVAVSDTGIDATHPDLAANMWTNPGEVPGNGVDDDGNGYVDDVHGWDFSGDGPNADDDHGHGTHVAGTIAAVGNAYGVVGVAFQSRVMAVKGLDRAGRGTTSDLAAGIVYAAENGARVVNASWGGLGAPSQTLADAIAFAKAAGTLVVAAAGNSAADIDVASGLRFEPAGIRDAIAVGASTPSDELTYFSNYGVKLDLVAPGGATLDPPPNTAPHRAILSCKAALAGSAMTGNGSLVVDGQWVRQAGTSMAAPHVTGAVAVLLSQRPELSPEQIRQALRFGADDVGVAGFDIGTGHGRLNVAGALAVGAPLVAHIAAPDNRLSISGTEPIAVTGSAFGPGFASYTVDFGAGEAPTAWTVATEATAEIVDGTLASIPIDTLPDGSMTIRLRAVDGGGRVFEDRIVASLSRVAIAAPALRSRFRESPIEIRGSADPGDFVSYRVEWREIGYGIWHTTGVTLENGGATRVRDGLLATFDVGHVGRAIRFDVRLIVTTSTGSVTRTTTNHIYDPDVRAGWPWPAFHYYAIGGARGGPTIADLDGDGMKEILVAFQFGWRSADNLVHVFEPDGTERPGWPVEHFATGGPSAGDLDGDGLMEVVVTSVNSMAIFRHDGTLVTGWPRTYGQRSREASFVLVDLDGDDALEIVFTSLNEVYAVRIDGSVVPGFPVNLGAFLSPYSAAGDVDGDGRPDIVVSTDKSPDGRTPGSVVQLYATVVDGEGNVKPRWPRRYGKIKEDKSSSLYLSGRPSPVAPVLADLDLDGRLDVVLTPQALNKVVAYHGDGRKMRTFRARLPKFRHRKADDLQDPLTVGDVSGDGIPDLVYTTNSGQETLNAFPHIGHDFLIALSPARPGGNLPGWPPPVPYLEYQQTTFKWHGAGASSIADIDGDGTQEVVLGLTHCFMWAVEQGRECNGPLAFRGDGSVVPGFPKLTHAPQTYTHTQPAVGDLDGDGLKEIVWAAATGEVIVWNVPGTPGPENAAWPMARQNAAHTAASP